MQLLEHQPSGKDIFQFTYLGNLLALAFVTLLMPPTFWYSAFSMSESLFSYLVSYG